MAIKKIIYVTEGARHIIPNIEPFGPDSDRQGGFTKETQIQLQRALDQVIIPEIGNDNIIFKSTGYNHPSWETLNYIKYLLKESKTSNVMNTDLWGKAEAGEIDNISQLKGDEMIVIFGTIYPDFKELIDSLKSNGYNVINKEAIIEYGNIYTLTVHLDGSKKADFREFGGDKE